MRRSRVDYQVRIIVKVQREAVLAFLHAYRQWRRVNAIFGHRNQTTAKVTGDSACFHTLLLNGSA